MDVHALILAAGRSQRMGQPKAWLMFEGVPILRRILATCMESTCAPPMVVAGASQPAEGLVSVREVRTRLSAWGWGDAVAVTVGKPDGSPIDSIRAGLGALPSEGHVLLWPVDQPFASTADVAALIAALQDRATHIAQLQVGESHAHPVLFGADVVQELLGPEADQGARAVVRRDPERIVQVPREDPRLLANLNRPEDAARWGVGS